MFACRPPVKNFRLAIVGGGIGGVILALGLLRRNVPVRIYEAASAFREVGLGLSIGPAAHRAIPLIDPRIRNIYDALITTHADSPGYERYRRTWFEMVWATGNNAGKVFLNLQALPSGQTSLRRADFLHCLLSLIPPGVIHYGKRLETFKETENGVEMFFKDRTCARADALIGCDGIHSKVRECMLPDERDRSAPQYSGMYGYRAVLDMRDMVEAVGEDRARVATIYVGQGAYAITYPIMRSKKVNVGLYVKQPHWNYNTWVRPAEKSEMYRDFDHMGDHVKAIMQRVTDSSQWAIFESRQHLSTYVKSRAVLLGDAAHASTPHQGAGAGQAVEDAHVLAELIGDPRVIQPQDLAAAFKAYDAVRRPRSQRVVTTSKEAGNLWCLSQKDVMDDEEKLKQTLTTRLRWLWDLDVEEQVNRAKSIMIEEMQRRNKGFSIYLSLSNHALVK